MDTGAARTGKPSKVFLKISRLCKLRSVGVSSSTEVKRSNFDGGNGEQERECDESREWKVNPENLEEAVASKVFARVSALKSAYIQLQQAHIPYEPKRIRSADEAVVSELELLSELERWYVEMRKKKLVPLADLKLEIEKHQAILEELQSQIEAKDKEILRLKWDIDELNCKNAELEEVDLQALSSGGIFPLNREMTPSLFSDVLVMAYKAVHDFAKPLISLMKASGWDLDRAAGSIVGSVIYAEKSHKKYAFEAYLSQMMLRDEEDQSCRLDHLNRIMCFQDPFDALVEDPDSSFGRFCRLKYLLVVQSKMEGSFFGNLDQRAFVSSGGHPRTPFYQAFIRMARWIWALREAACSFIPRAQAFYRKKGEQYCEDFMESIVDKKMVEGEKELNVRFTVMPGFKIGAYFIKCKVYLCRAKVSNNAE